MQTIQIKWKKTSVGHLLCSPSPLSSYKINLITTFQFSCKIDLIDINCWNIDDKRFMLRFCRTSFAIIAINSMIRSRYWNVLQLLPATLQSNIYLVPITGSQHLSYINFSFSFAVVVALWSPKVSSRYILSSI